MYIYWIFCLYCVLNYNTHNVVTTETIRLNHA